MPTNKFLRPLCAQCGKRVWSGKRLCRRHLKLDRDRQRARSQRKKEQGLCYFAGCTNPHEVGKNCCDTHLWYFRGYYIRRRLKLGRLEDDTIRATREGLGQVPAL